MAKSLLQHFSVRDVYHHLRAFNRKGYLTEDDDEAGLVQVVADILGKRWDVRKCRIMPAEVIRLLR